MVFPIHFSFCTFYSTLYVDLTEICINHSTPWPEVLARDSLLWRWYLHLDPMKRLGGSTLLQLQLHPWSPPREAKKQPWEHQQPWADSKCGQTPSPWGRFGAGARMRPCLASAAQSPWHHTVNVRCELCYCQRYNGEKYLTLHSPSLKLSFCRTSCFPLCLFKLSQV